MGARVRIRARVTAVRTYAKEVCIDGGVRVWFIESEAKIWVATR